MTPANKLTAELLIEIPKTLPACRVWRQNTGGGVGMSTVRQSIALLRSGNVRDAIQLLSSRPIKWGIEGAGDISGVGPVGIRIELEVKAGNDRLSDEQRAFGAMIERAGGVYVVARDVDGTIEELSAKLYKAGVPEVYTGI